MGFADKNLIDMQKNVLAAKIYASNTGLVKTFLIASLI